MQSYICSLFQGEFLELSGKTRLLASDNILAIQVRENHHFVYADKFQELISVKGLVVLIVEKYLATFS